MKVGQRHGVPDSLSPLGPSGLGHIQNDRPQFIPGFLVTREMQSSWWPSHFGTGFLVKTFDHDSVGLHEGTTELSGEAITPVGTGSFFSAVDAKSLAGVILTSAGASCGESLEAVAFSSLTARLVLSDLKNPARVCWPLLRAPAGRPFGFSLLDGGAWAPLLCDLLGGGFIVTGAPFVSRVLLVCEAGPGISDPVWVSVVVDTFTSLLFRDREWFRNISLIFLRRSNSGINFPDSAKGVILLERGCSTPSSNVPLGFMMSKMWTSFPSRWTLSLIDA